MREEVRNSVVLVLDVIVYQEPEQRSAIMYLSSPVHFITWIIVGDMMSSNRGNDKNGISRLGPGI